MRLSIRLFIFLLSVLSLLLPLFTNVSTIRAAALPYTDGDLLQAIGDDKIHLVQGGQRHWIADTTSLQQLNPDFSRLRRVPFEEIRAIPAGKPIRNGPLIRDAATGKIYLLTKETDWPDARKHWINNLEAFTSLGFEWNDVALNWPTPPDQYAYAPTLTFAPVSRDPAPVTAPEGAFVGVPAWRLQVQDERLFLALSVAYTYNQDWRTQVAGKLAAAGTWIEWGALPADVGGLYDGGLNKITINQSLQGDSLGVLAATLTHEVLHAVSNHGTDVTACYAEEAAAFAYQAGTWAAIPDSLRSRSSEAQFLDALTAAYRRVGLAGIQRTVAADPAYQEECATNAGLRGQGQTSRPAFA